MARISYVDPGTVADPELAGYLADAREHGTPRLESQAIRAHVPAVLRTFSQSWTARCSHAGHGTGARNCTQESTRPPE